MLSVKKFFTALFLFSCLATSAFAKKMTEEEEKAARDLQIGMQGLKQAGSDPALLAQLMRDLQDPEIMAEAKKMMESPEFQKQMKQLSGSKEFKDSIKNAESVMADPSRAAEMEARMEHMIKRGNDELKKGAANMMEDTMAAMMENPALMNEMTQMLKDPNFQQQLAEMMKDPSFASYREAMQDMMNDPQKKRQIEQIGNSMKQQL